MKGIRKLFFGLIFMTLIGVGFNVDVSAHQANVELSFQKYKDGTETQSSPTKYNNYSQSDTVLYGVITFDDNCWPIIDTGGTNGDRVIYKYTTKLKRPDGNIEQATIQLITVVEDSGVSNETIVTIGSGTPQVLSVKKSTNFVTLKKGRDTVRDEVNWAQGTDPTVTGSYELSATVEQPTIPDGVTVTNNPYVAPVTVVTDASEDITLGGVFGGAYKGDDWSSNLSITTDSNNEYSASNIKPFYMFEGEKETFKASSPGGSYTFDKWTAAADDSSTGDTISTTEASADYTMTTPVRRYIKARYKEGSTPKAYTITLKTDGNGTVTGPSGADKDDVITLTATPNRGYSVDKWVSSEVTVTEITTTQGKFNMPDKNITVSVWFKKDGSSSGVDPIYVTKGKTVPLSRFITDETLLTNNISLKSGGYTTFADSATASSWSTTINKPGKSIYVLGNQVTDTREDITVNGSETDKVNVTVYPTPSVKVNSSGGAIVDSATGSSNSSGKSPFTVIMPTSVAYDNVEYDNINQAQYQVIGSRGSQGAILPLSTSSGSGSSSTKSREASWLTVAKLLDKACEESDEWVTVRAYPVNPSTGQTDTNVSGEAQIKVYRIKLDSSEGAKYTVNGVDLGEIASGDHDYFYAVDGVSYTIVSSAKSTGTTLQRWDDDENNKSNTRTFTASSSKTYKAIYSSNTTTSSSRSSSSSSSTGRTTAAGGSGGSSGSGMDDYDDVPKTGESKADIWILWSVLFISILGAGFMIWKRFGLVKAIAEADEEVAYAEHEEMAEAKKQEKESKLKMLMDLRNLK